MDELITQVLRPETSLFGRILALVVIAAVALFFYMATTSLNAGRNSRLARREAAKDNERAEALAREARRELASKE